MSEPTEPKIRNFNDMSYTEQLLHWGRSGTYRPNFLPTQQSVQELTTLQGQICAKVPGAVPINGFHCTVYYCKPQALYEHLKAEGELSPTSNEPQFYADLTNVIAVSLFPGNLGVTDGDFSIAGFEIVGGSNPILALRVGDTSYAAQLRKVQRELLLYNLKYHINQDALSRLADHPDFMWMVKDSVPHISLATLPLGATLPRGLVAPPEVVFDATTIGSIKHPVDNPQDATEVQKWYLGLYPNNSF